MSMSGAGGLGSGTGVNSMSHIGNAASPTSVNSSSAAAAASASYAAALNNSLMGSAYASSPSSLINTQVSKSLHDLFVSLF